MAKDMLCKNCEHCYIYSDGRRGECRRYPPNPVKVHMDESDRYINVVLDHHWCGEYKRSNRR